MTDYITPRSVSRLEAEIEALEREAAGETPTEEQEVVEEVEEQEAAPLTKEEQTWQKRYADLRKLSQKQADDLKKLNAKIEGLENKPAQFEISTKEDAEKWAKENPKAAAIIRALAVEQVVHTAPKNDDVENIRKELEKNKQEARIKKIHPDFEEITASNEFHDWAESQTQSVQNLIYDGSAEDVIWALSIYKKDTDKTNPKKDAAKAVANKMSSAPSDTGDKPYFTESQVQKMSLAEYEKNEAKIQEAMRLGTFKYDLSGAAR